MLYKLYAIFKRDFLIAISYRFKFVLQIFGILFSTLMFYFMAKLVGNGMENQLAPYGGNYFAFVLIGIAFGDFLTLSLGGFSSEIRNAQLLGTLESLLVTPTSIATILFSSCLYNFAFTSTRILLYLLVGIFIFHLQLQLASIPAFLLVLLLTVISFAGIGLLSAAFIIVFKQGSPITWIMGTTAGLFGGILYPVSVLPLWLKPVSSILPITHSLEAMRQILINGASLSAVIDQVLILFIFSSLLMPVGLYSFLYGLSIAKKEGSLAHY